MENCVKIVMESNVLLNVFQQISLKLHMEFSQHIRNQIQNHNQIFFLLTYIRII